MAEIRGLTVKQQRKYARDGWVVLDSLFTEEECEGFIQHMDAVHSGEVKVAGFVPPLEDMGHLIDVDQCHIEDSVCEAFMLHPKLRQPLKEALRGDEPEGVKSHFWWKNSQWSQNWHCDGTALPECVGVWIPLIDVNEDVGTLALQTGGHLRRKIQHDDLRLGKWAGNRTHSGDPNLSKRLKQEIFEENKRSGLEEVHIVTKRGAAVIFDGYLWHRGLMGKNKDSFRQVFACHYVPESFDNWPHVLWERINFDGIRRWTTGGETSTAGKHNARLPMHPAMKFSSSRKHASLLPTRKDAPLKILSDQQANDLDEKGFTVLENVFSVEKIKSLREKIDSLEKESVDRIKNDKEQSVRTITNVDQITFTSGLAQESELARSFCADAVFQKICFDVLNCDNVRLYHEQAVYKKPCPGRIFPYHQDNGYTFTEPLQYLTCWVALTDATEENGCPWFIPRLFRRGPLSHEFDELNKGWTIKGLRTEDAVCVPVKAGSVAIFWSLTPHMTGANNTLDIRKAYVCQYAPDGFNNRIWDKGANSGQGGEVTVDTKEKNQLDEKKNFLILKLGKGVQPPQMGPK